jgi:hypothetical protein
MNIYRNDRLINRNAKIAQIGLVVTLAILVSGMVISLKYSDQILLAYGLLIVGFMLFQVTIYYQNRWGRKPRTDMLLDQSLKGFDNRHSLFHYRSPVSHLLVGPSGIWILIPFYQRGKFSYENGRYKQTGRSLYWKIFGQDGLGKPELNIAIGKENLGKFIEAHFPTGEAPDYEAILVFTDPQALVNIEPEDPTPAPTVQVKNLKEAIRKLAKGKSLNIDKVKILQAALLED